jgi:uncharacterized alpha-E superfamily protein
MTSLSPSLTPTLRSYTPRERHVLARVADSTYWMARYVERAEHIARLLAVSANLLTDVGDLEPELLDAQWMGVPGVFRQFALPASDLPIAARVVRHMTLNPENPNSILNCLTKARENARAVREIISAEMWESLNGLYWQINAEDAAPRIDESPEDFFRSIMTGSMLFQGLCDQTLAHEQPWMFAQLGKHLERVDVTCRIVETRFELLTRYESQLETPVRNIHWMSVVRMCCGIEAYRRQHLGDLDPLKMAAFLILERTFPRSVRYGVEQALAAISGIHDATRRPGVDPAERILGRLSAQLEYAEPAEIFSVGLPRYLSGITAGLAEAAVAVGQTYFLQ